MVQAGNLPTRNALKDNWDAVSTATMSGKAVTVLITDKISHLTGGHMQRAERRKPSNRATYRNY
jgi:hypothetical protein